jgi:hypothetical protein
MNTIQVASCKSQARCGSQGTGQKLVYRRLLHAAWLITITIFVGTLRSQTATATLSGKVVEASNGETLPGATVQLQPGGRGTSTDQHGRFVFSNVTPGKYQVQVSFIGFETKRDSISLAPGQARHLHLMLRQQALKLPEVTVTAERDRRIKEVNLSREVISSAELRMTSAVAEPDLFRSLALLPGVAQANDFNSRFYVRGGQSNENHVLVEGMTIHNPYHGLGFFSTFDVDAIKAVEVHRSIFPVRYNERLSSVTNVILRDGNAQHFSGLGMISLATSKLLIEGPLLKYRPDSGRKWTFMLNGRRTYADAFLDYPLYFYDFSLKSVYDSGRKTRVTLHGFYGLDRFQNRDAPFPFPSFGEIFSDVRWNNLAVGVRWQQFLSNGSIWSNHVSYSTFHSLAKDSRPSPVSIDSIDTSLQDNEIRELSFNSEWQGRLLNWQLTLGYQWSRFDIDQDLEPSVVDYFRQSFTGRWRANDQHKVYAELDGGWGDHWLYEAGLAALYFSAHGSSALAPRLGVKYLVNDTWRLKAGAARHYQYLTTLEDDDEPVLLFDAWLPTPRDRKIAQANHYGLGVEISRSPAVEVDVELYYHRNDHLTRFNRTQRPGEPFYLDGWSESYGLDVRAHYNFKRYYGFANYSLGWATSHFLLRNQPMRFANDFRWQTFPSNGDIRHILNAVIGIRPGGKWDLNVTFVFQSGRPYTAVLGKLTDLVEMPHFWELFQYYGSVRSIYFEGLPGFVYSSKNGRRYPFYQRVDFRAARHFRLFSIDWIFFFQVYNIFYRKNPGFRFPDTSIFPIEPSNPKGLPIVPTFGLTFRF